MELCDHYSGYHDHNNEGEQEHVHNKFTLADSHLGNFLNIGNNILGYDLVSSVLYRGRRMVNE